MRKAVCAICLIGVSLMSCLSPSERDQKEVRIICNRVADWQIENQPNVIHHDLDWTNGAWYKGLVEWAKLTDNQRYFNFLKAQGEKNDWNVYKRIYHADDICVAQMYIELFNKFGNRNILLPTIERIDYVVANPSAAPLQKSDPIGKDERWSWCDALFMAPPVYAAMYKLTGKKEYVEYMESEFKLCTDSLFDVNEKLYYRDNTKIPLVEPNGAKQFWGRGNGWVFAAIPIILDNLPKDYPNRGYYENIFKEMATSVLRTQDAKGSWHASLLNPETYPMPENSASAFFCYGLAWGMRNGLLDESKYKDTTLKAWKSLTQYVNKQGRLGYIQPVGNAPKMVDENSTDVYGVGAFLLAGTEMYQLFAN
jgi:rhamnogalacturonyl hydrolase YesR